MVAQQIHGDVESQPVKQGEYQLDHTSAGVDGAQRDQALHQHKDQPDEIQSSARKGKPAPGPENPPDSHDDGENDQAQPAKPIKPEAAQRTADQGKIDQQQKNNALLIQESKV